MVQVGDGRKPSVNHVAIVVVGDPKVEDILVSSGKRKHFWNLCGSFAFSGVNVFL
jgi:hypothetical protein